MPRGSKPEKEAKRRVVAKGVVAGKSTAAIAREAKVSTRHVERLAAEPETKLLITELLKPHHAKLKKLVERSLTAISTALTAKITDKADHRARLIAVRRTKDLLELAQGHTEPAGNVGAELKFAGTMEELLVLYRKITRQGKASKAE